MAVKRGNIGALANKFQQPSEQPSSAPPLAKRVTNKEVVASPATPAAPTTPATTEHLQNGFHHDAPTNGHHEDASSLHSTDSSADTSSTATASHTPNNVAISTPTPVSNPLKTSTSSATTRSASIASSSTVTSTTPLIDLFQGLYTTHFIKKHEAAANEFEAECLRSKERVRGELDKLRKQLNEATQTGVTLPTPEVRKKGSVVLSNSSQSMSISGTELQWGLLQLIQQREIEAAKELCQGGRTLSSLLERNTEAIANGFAEKALSSSSSSTPLPPSSKSRGD